MENRIDNDPTISSQTKLWGDENSTVVRGNMIIVPIKDSLLYVEPVYITTSNTASFPELKRIIVAYKETIVMEPTLQECFAKLFSGNSSPPGASGKPTIQTPTLKPPVEGVDGEAEQLLRTVVDLYERYKQYNAENDFENAGKIMRDIDEKLNRANELFAGQGQRRRKPTRQRSRPQRRSPAAV